MKTNNPFLYFGTQLHELFGKAAAQEQPALWLFNNKARTTLFMLESLCRLFDQGLQDSRFTHWHKTFKKLEDLLGEVDLYDTFIKEFSKHKKISPDSLYYLQSKREKALKKFSRKIKKGGYSDEGFRDFLTRIRKMRLRFDEKMVVLIEAAIKAELLKVNVFAAYNDYAYSELEDQVHELRRKLRWIGIYTESLRGIIKPADDGNDYKWERKYLTKKSLASPYNKFNHGISYKRHIHFEKKHFIALNWMITELGILKDKGINVQLLAKAIRKTEHIEQAAAVKKAMGILGIKQTEHMVVRKASQLAREFFATNRITENILYTPPQKIRLKKSPPTFKLQLKIRNKKV